MPDLTTTYGRPALHLPIVPSEILKRFFVDEAADTRFASNARLLQAIWREDMGMEAGRHQGRDGRSRILGSRLSPADAAKGRNFLTPDIARIVYREVAYREIGALIDEQRLWANLLSSQPLTFNLFARCRANPDYASDLFSILFPDFISRVTDIAFEHSPGRGDPAFLGDGTAFDLFVSGMSPDGAPAFVAIEVKYAEAMHQPLRGARQRYRELASAQGLHVDPEAGALVSEALSQLTAEHLLAGLIRNQMGSTTHGLFVVLAPRQNREAWNAILLYKAQVRDDAPVAFLAIDLDAVITAIGQVEQDDLASRLRARYTDFTPVHALIDGWEPFAE
ncbi:hypothetical protein GCM10007301_38150 [Azorhizobium oxalatiphilum]|uniref:PD-(D/E)XK nuclease-like domain-containing protein n=1 Tax=Azorhizobium oxalatiphilum TaxID=980631 RepID=A0A917C955_9HYPH|nr:hypothetical protein [Azorhizobium oxalatiphilum]GGF74656.1 hypothetical protein GCM10007301_38150 [Azorhizobium oxalatiphilum]